MFVNRSAILVYICSIFMWINILQILATAPPNFPSTIPLTITNYQNWANTLTVYNLWTATPSTPTDVVTLANWAYANNYTLRANGYMHGWSPLTVTQVSNCQNVVLVNTAVNLVHMELTTSPNTSISAVKVQTGASMTDLLTFLEQNQLGIYSTPAPGDITVGGVIAIGGHGTAIPAVGETATPGHAYGTISNLVISLTAVVWNNTSNSYVLKTFQRSDADAKAFLVHLGRAFLTEVTLMVGANYNLSCISRTDISSDELFADPATVNSTTRTIDSFLNQTGRVEAIWFPFTSNPWLKIWNISSTQPPSSRAVSSPFNYPFANTIPEIVSNLLALITNGAWYLTPLLSQLQYTITSLGLTATASSNIWGPSKDLLLYVKPTTLREAANGYAIITSRPNVQKVINSITVYYNNLLNEYADQNQYPVNGVAEIRVTGLDVPGVVTQGESPALSAVHPVNNHPEFDVAVWFDILSYPNTPYSNEYLEKIESFLYSTYNGSDAIIRAEWSKGWAYTDQSAWINENVLRNFIPGSFPSGSGNDGWNWTVSTLDKYDPNRIFTNAFLDEFLVSV